MNNIKVIIDLILTTSNEESLNLLFANLVEEYNNSNHCVSMLVKFSKQRLLGSIHD